MFKVFVSYSVHDLRNVSELQQSLIGTGVEVFVAEHSVRPSESLSEKISVAIVACDLFVLLWSSNAQASQWVSQEIGKAHSLKKRILPLVFTEALPLPGFISGLKYIPVYLDPVVAMQRARALVLGLLEKKKQAEALTLLAFGGIFLWAFSQK